MPVSFKFTYSKSECSFNIFSYHRTILQNFDRKAYSMTLEFYVVNTPTELVTLDVMLERLR